MPVFGLVVAGPYDEAILKTFVRRVRPEVSDVQCRQCVNDPGVRKKFKSFLEHFKRAKAGDPVDKALVICDAHRIPQEEVKQRLTSVVVQFEK